MDILRSAHKTTAWVGSDNDTQVTLRWYKCAEGAKVFPHFHAFGSPVWEPDPANWTEGPGVELEPLEWVTSVYPAPPGQEFHGRREWYEKGIPQAILDNPGPHEQEPCVAEIVPDVCNIRCAPVALDPDFCRLRVDFQDFTL